MMVGRKASIQTKNSLNSLFITFITLTPGENSSCQRDDCHAHVTHSPHSLPHDNAKPPRDLRCTNFYKSKLAVKWLYDC